MPTQRMPAEAATGSADLEALQTAAADKLEALAAGKPVRAVPLEARVVPLEVRAVLVRHCTATTLRAVRRARLHAVRGQPVRVAVPRVRAAAVQATWRHSTATVRVAQVARVVQAVRTARLAGAAALALAGRVDAVLRAPAEPTEPMPRVRAQQAGAEQVLVATRSPVLAEPAGAAMHWAASRAAARQVAAPAAAGRATGYLEPVVRTIQ